MVLEVGLEGLGTPLALDAVPRLVSMPGSLTPGGMASRSVVLRNPTRAPAHYRIVAPRPAGMLKGDKAAAGRPPLSVSPAAGVVPPMSDAEVTITFMASGSGAEGQHRHQLLCKVTT